MLYIAVRLIHLLSMAFWLSSYVKELGSPLVFEGDKEKDSQLHARREHIAGALGTISGVTALASGCVLVFLQGYQNVPWPIYAGFAVAIVMSFIGAFGVGGAYHYLGKAIENDAELSELEALSAKLRKWSAIGLALWLITFGLMVLRYVL